MAFDEKISDGEKRTANDCHDNSHDAASGNGPVPINVADMMHEKDYFNADGESEQDEHDPSDNRQVGNGF